MVTSKSPHFVRSTLIEITPLEKWHQNFIRNLAAGRSEQNSQMVAVCGQRFGWCPSFQVLVDKIIKYFFRYTCQSTRIKSMVVGLLPAKSTFTKVVAKNRQNVNPQFTMEPYRAVITIVTLVVVGVNMVKIWPIVSILIESIGTQRKWHFLLMIIHIIKASIQKWTVLLCQFVDTVLNPQQS